MAPLRLGEHGLLLAYQSTAFGSFHVRFTMAKLSTRILK
jgi:hypothetical protein